MSATDRAAGGALSERRPVDAVDAVGAGASVAVLTGAAMAAIAAGQLWLIVHRSWNADEFEHAHATWSLARGLLPYRDFFEHHTPWLYFAFAPLFANPAVATDSDAALLLLLRCRFAMLAVTIACVALTGLLGRLWQDARTGWLAAFFLASSIQFLDTMIEFRPDVPALACWLASLVCAVRGWRADRAAAIAWFGAGGLAFAAAFLFTQKYVFALPGVALMLAAYIARPRAGAAGPGIRLGAVAAFIAGLCIPVAATFVWFASRRAGAAFIYYNFGFNVAQNDNRFSPLPILLSNLVHSPILMAIGVSGFATAIGAIRQRGADDRVPLLATAASLLAGLFVFGRVYGQYLVMFFPHLAVFAAAIAPAVVDRLRGRLNDYRHLLVGLWLVPPAALGALLIGIEGVRSAKGIAMLVGFTIAAALGAIALRAHADGQRHRALAVAIAAFTAMAAGNAARIFWPMAPQVADLAYVTERTRPDDLFLGSGLPAGAGTFRPHAWFFFFQPIFASDRDLADLADQMTTGRVRPKIIGFDVHDGGIPLPLRGYVQAHYRWVRGELYERLPD